MRLKKLYELAGFNSPITKTYYNGDERREETCPTKKECDLIGTYAACRTFIRFALSRSNT